MVREVAVQIAPAAVLGGIDAHHRVALGRHGRPVHLHVVPAAERGGRLAGIDRDLLTTPGAQLPQIGDGEADRRERGGAGLADAERRRQDRIGAAGDLDRAGALLAPAGDRAGSYGAHRRGHGRNLLPEAPRCYVGKAFSVAMRRGLQVVGVHVVRQHRVAGDQIRQGHGPALPEAGRGGVEGRPADLAVLEKLAGEVHHGLLLGIEVGQRALLANVVHDVVVARRPAAPRPRERTR